MALGTPDSVRNVFCILQMELVCVGCALHVVENPYYFRSLICLACLLISVSEWVWRSMIPIPPPVLFLLAHLSGVRYVLFSG